MTAFGQTAGARAMPPNSVIAGLRAHNPAMAMTLIELANSFEGGFHTISQSRGPRSPQLTAQQ